MEINKSDLESLADLRIKEAKLLLDGKKYSGAYYIAGYSVELALKACIAKNFRANILPDKKFVNDIYTHKLKELIGLAGLKSDLDSEIRKNPQFSGNWSLVNDWSEEARYKIWDVVNASALYEAITNPTNGVMQWLKKYY